MRFRYAPYKGETGPDGEYEKYPLLQVRLKNGNKTLNVDALVDSGATTCIFSYDIARELGIKLNRCKVRKFEGIGDIEVKGRACMLQMHITGFDFWITVDAGFLKQNDLPLLGQSGLFEYFEITFRRYQNRFELTKRPGRFTPRPRPNRRSRR